MSNGTQFVRDLREASDVQKNVDSAIEKVNKAWGRVDEFLRALNVPVSTYHKARVWWAGSGGDVECIHYLIWRKWGKQWRVCFCDFNDFSPETCEDVPIKDAPVEVRGEYLEDVPKLYKAILAEAGKFCVKAESEADAVLSKLRVVDGVPCLTEERELLQNPS